MAVMGEAKKPYAAFGRTLRDMRSRANQSLDEVSGAVEINKNELIRIENGEIRPSEEVLVLLISYFDPAEKDIMNLWRQAGYTKTDFETADSGELPQHTVLMTSIDTRIVYTDVVHVMVNNYGVVMNFMQSSGTNNQPLAVARIGMSREHATSVLNILQKTLSQTSGSPKMPKSLTAGDDSVLRKKHP